MLLVSHVIFFNSKLKICLEKGEVYGWGFNFYDQLGFGESDRDVEK